MAFEWSCGVLLCQNSFPLPCVCVCVCFSKKRMDNCPTLLKRVCCVQYNLPHPSLKLTMTFEWSYVVPLYQNPFPSPLYICVCVFVSLKKRMGNCLTLLKRVCYVQYNLSHPSLKVIIAFEQSCDVPLCQNSFLSPLCVCVCFSKKRMGNCLTLLKRVYCVQYNLLHPPLKVTIALEWSCGVPLCHDPNPWNMNLDA